MRQSYAERKFYSEMRAEASRPRERVLLALIVFHVLLMFAITAASFSEGGERWLYQHTDHGGSR